MATLSRSDKAGWPELTTLQLLRLAAVGGELVAVEIADIAGIGVGPEAARSDGALVLAAGGKRRLVEGGDRGAARRLEADGAAIGVRRGLAVGGLQHHEFLGRGAPARAAIPEILQALQPERRQCRVIECARLGEIVGADRDMRESCHRFLPRVVASKDAASWVPAAGLRPKPISLPGSGKPANGFWPVAVVEPWLLRDPTAF